MSVILFLFIESFICNWLAEAHCWPRSEWVAVSCSWPSAPQPCHLSGQRATSSLSRFCWMGQSGCGQHCPPTSKLPGDAGPRGRSRHRLTSFSRDHTSEPHGDLLVGGQLNLMEVCLCRAMPMPGVKKRNTHADPRAFCEQCRDNKPKHRVQPL